MGKLLASTAILVLLFWVTPAVWSAEWRAGVDLGQTSGKVREPWIEGGVGKFGDTADEGFLQGYLELKHRINDVTHLEIVGELSDTSRQPWVGVTEAFLQWRPVPTSRYRWQAKVGMFYPPVSLENDNDGWRSRHTRSFSAINSWIGEEVRTLGTQFSVEWRPWQMHSGRLQLGGALFMGNDPAGTLLAWRGWSSHAQQSRWADDLPLQALPQFQQGRFFADQNPYVEPFKEIDNRPGFYAFAQWRLPRRLVVKAMHYDNLAKPTALEGGQYAWQTRFDALGVRTEVAGFELISQWMKGSTLMGSRWEATANFRSVFALVAKQFGEHRIALRYEDSLVRQFDNTPQDNNDETTDGLTVSYGWQINSHWQLQAEWQRQRTWRPGWMYANLTPRADEALWQLGLHWRSKRR